MLWTWEQQMIHAPAAAQHLAAQRKARRDAALAEGRLWLWAFDSRKLLADLDRRDRRDERGRRPHWQPFTLREVRDAVGRLRQYSTGATLQPLDSRAAGRQRGILIRFGLWGGAWSHTDET
jgi:hypothetical protein